VGGVAFADPRREAMGGQVVEAVVDGSINPGMEN
jgi:hypothetical protein